MLIIFITGTTKVYNWETWSWQLTHWGRVTHICVSNLAIIGSDNGLSPGRRQAIIWTNAGILSIGPLGTNFSEILIQNRMEMDLKVSSAKWQPFCLGLNVLIAASNSPIMKLLLEVTLSSPHHYYYEFASLISSCLFACIPQCSHIFTHIHYGVDKLGTHWPLRKCFITENAYVCISIKSC